MILTVTPNPLLDYVLHSKGVPEPGGMRIDNIPSTVGGKGINVARMLKTLGRPALALSFAGGENGNKIRAGLKAQGIASELIPTIAETRVGINLVVESPTYHTWWIENGAELRRTEIDQMVERVRELLVETSFIAISGTIPGRLNDDLYWKILDVCKGFKGEIYLDARGEPLRRACQAGGFFLKHNRDEALETFSLDPFKIDEQQLFFAELTRKKIWGAMVTDGKNNVLVWDGEQIVEMSPAPSREVSAVGCGDATLAGFLYGRANGFSIIESARWGLAAGSADSESAGPCEAEFELIEEKLPQIKSHSLKPISL